MRTLWLINDYPEIFSPPKHLTNVNAWHQHIPFAFFITKATKPQTFIELGVHAGDSYLAFCEGIRMSSLCDTTKATGVDTFEGDSNSGVYGPELFQTLKPLHDADYGSFSTLVKARFEDYANEVPDGSVDLLHLDGCHETEAVRRDYAMWLPKMSDKGVMLLHDTAVIDAPAFGVWGLWAEIRNKFPSFSFAHGNGLGVLCVGKTPPTDVVALCKTDSTFEGEWYRDLFRLLGRRIHLSERELFAR